MSKVDELKARYLLGLSSNNHPYAASMRDLDALLEAATKQGFKEGYKEALDKYGNHHTNCSYFDKDGPYCTCEFAAKYNGEGLF